MRLPDGESCCFSLPERAGPVTVAAAGLVWMHCTRMGRYWTRVGGTAGRWGLRAVGTTLGQWIPTLVEQAYSGRDSKRNLRPTMTTGTLRRLQARERCRRTCEKGAGLCGKTHGLSLLRGPVSTAPTLPSLPSKHPEGIVEILRSFFGVQHRCGVDVSTMDTHTPSGRAPGTHPGTADSGGARAHARRSRDPPGLVVMKRSAVVG